MLVVPKLSEPTSCASMKESAVKRVAMATKNANLDEVLGKARDTARKTQELLREAEVLHNTADAAHRKAEEIHGRITQSRQAAHDRNNRKARKS